MSWNRGAKSCSTHARPGWSGNRAKEAWEAKLAALRSYRRATGHLAPRQDAVGRGRSDGAHRATLGQPPARAASGRPRAGRGTREAARRDRPGPELPLALDWQRHYRVLADLVGADGSLPEIQPAVLMDGDDIGRWLQRQTQPGTWAQLSTEQQERLSRLGITPAEAPSGAPRRRGVRRKGARATRSRRSGAARQPSGNGLNGKAPAGQSRAVRGLFCFSRAIPMRLRTGKGLSAAIRTASLIGDVACCGARGSPWRRTGPRCQPSRRALRVG